MGSRSGGASRAGRGTIALSADQRDRLLQRAGLYNQAAGNLRGTYTGGPTNPIDVADAVVREAQSSLLTDVANGMNLTDAYTRAEQVRQQGIDTFNSTLAGRAQQAGVSRLGRIGSLPVGYGRTQLRGIQQFARMIVEHG